MLEKAAESPASSTRFVGQVLQDGLEFKLHAAINASFVQPELKPRKSAKNERSDQIIS
ncbi:MAG: hypothetical protein HQ525_00760 [Anaerolineae bacterium]|nr:hypothetical protein [Anaerolineae bacterium]